MNRNEIKNSSQNVDIIEEMNEGDFEKGDIAERVVSARVSGNIIQVVIEWK